MKINLILIFLVFFTSCSSQKQISQQKQTQTYNLEHHDYYFEYNNYLGYYKPLYK